MKTIVSLSGGYGSTYNLWQLAKNTTDDITAVFVDFEYFMSIPKGRLYKKSISSIPKGYSQSVSSWISSNVRSINFVVLNLDNYQPAYSGIPQLELVNYAKMNGFDKIVFSDDIKDEATPQAMLRRAVSRVNDSIIVSYPLRDMSSTNYQCSKLLPNDLKPLCLPNNIQESSVILEQNGMSESSIVQKQIEYSRDAFIERNQEWVHNDTDFGLTTFEQNYATYYPQYPTLWKD